MKILNLKTFVVTICSLTLLSLSLLAQDPAPVNPPPATTASSGRTASRTDGEIQKCIQGKLANSDKLRVQEFNVSVSNSEATFTGTARNAGSKGAATRIGQSCGAAKVVNNISAPAIPRPAKKVEGRTSL
jgi:hypothetical protein